jgi:hypothetical protein
MPRRATDRVEDVAAWAFTAMALLLVVVAAGVGGDVHRDGVARAATESQQRHRVPAEVLAEERSEEHPTGNRFRSVPARWAGPDGVPVTGRVTLDPALPVGRTGVPPRAASAAPGQQVTIWVDGSGQPTRPPATAEQASQAGVVAAVVMVLLGLIVLSGGWIGVRALVARSNDRRWERDWARVGPLWSGRVH